ncbi:hypothetical protein [Microbulbifer thermotolerans]|uniref:hypothetical protein n=1 Tax=Microbulbifer thermotolerans TaxID=252514 RepID=UPI001586FC07|nr:hypothetical protein [Microbulbifer thermotolerans]
MNQDKKLWRSASHLWKKIDKNGKNQQWRGLWRNDQFFQPVHKYRLHGAPKI